MLITSGLSGLTPLVNQAKQGSSVNASAEKKNGGDVRVSSGDVPEVSVEEFSRKSRMVRDENVAASRYEFKDIQSALDFTAITQKRMMERNDTALLAQANASKQTILQLLSQ